jgi:uncharacterized protein YrzB (UPF0473 family)
VSDSNLCLDTSDTCSLERAGFSAAAKLLKTDLEQASTNTIIATPESGAIAEKEESSASLGDLTLVDSTGDISLELIQTPKQMTSPLTAFSSSKQARKDDSLIGEGPEGGRDDPMEVGTEDKTREVSGDEGDSLFGEEGDEEVQQGEEALRTTIKQENGADKRKNDDTSSSPSARMERQESRPERKEDTPVSTDLGYLFTVSREAFRYSSRGSPVDDNYSGSPFLRIHNA